MYFITNWFCCYIRVPELHFFASAGAFIALKADVEIRENTGTLIRKLSH